MERFAPGGAPLFASRRGVFLLFFPPRSLLTDLSLAFRFSSRVCSHLTATGSKSQTNKKDRTVHRPYGGVLSGANVKERIIRAFLIEEQKIVKKVLKLQSKKTTKK